MSKRIKAVSRIFSIEAEITEANDEAGRHDEQWSGLDELWVPPIDVSERGDYLYVRVELPGINENDISLNLHSSRIEVKGIKREHPPEKKLRFHLLEREYGHFRRVVYFPGSVETAQPRAFMENGVLTLVLKKYRQKRIEAVLKIDDGEEK